jgi:hypothetical protein
MVTMTTTTKTESSIPLTKGLSARIDVADANFMKETWLAHRVDKRFYAARRVGWKGPYIYLHRLIAGALPGEDVDHVNGDTLDNRRCNLRRCTRQQNLQGFKRKRAGATSKYRGVSFSRTERNWRAQIEVDGKNKYLGRFSDERAAAVAYNIAALRFFKEFAQLNDLSEG